MMMLYLEYNDGDIVTANVRYASISDGVLRYELLPEDISGRGSAKVSDLKNAWIHHYGLKTKLI